MAKYLEIGPLREREYTGIAHVTSVLAERSLGDSSAEWSYFFGRALVPNKVVEAVLIRRDGELLEWTLGRLDPRPAPRSLLERSVALFPNRKTCRRGFTFETQIIHDLTTLLTPQFHHPDTIAFHANTIEQDVKSNDVTFCVSENTRADLLTYFPEIPADRVCVAYLASSLSSETATRNIARPDAVANVEPFILVLGTLEPRKNIAQVLSYISDNPTILKSYRFVFIGRYGWGVDVKEQLANYKLQSAIDSGALLFPGFVSEEVKHQLLQCARLLIYPSLYEGFGLPLIEALSVGLPCVTTASSSLPEVGGEVAYYFDPTIRGDFDRAFRKALLELRRNSARIREQCIEHSKRFSWGDFYKTVNGKLDMLIQAEGIGNAGGR